MSAAVKLVKMDGSEAGTVELNEAVFGAEMSDALVHEVAVALRASRHQGTAETKTRWQVRGGGAKPYRQKGTGNARHGSMREPQMRGGGTVFGPHRRSYRQQVPARKKRTALCCVLSDRVRGGDLCVLDQLDVAEPKTKPFADMVSRVAPGSKSTLLVTGSADRKVFLSARNIPGVAVTTAADLNALDVLNAKRVVLVQDALAQLEERLA